MNRNKQNSNWMIDVLLLVGFLFSFYLDLTGVIMHEWLGASLAVLAIMHLLLHWDWVKATTRRLFGKTPSRNRWYYVIDLLIGLGFVVIIETGLVISTWFNLDLYDYLVWVDIHAISSIATLALTVLKVGLHWRWVVNITGKIFGTTKPPARQPVMVPVPLTSKVIRKASKGAVDRRQFLSMMGVVGLGSALAIYNVVSERNDHQVLAMAEPDASVDVTEDFIVQADDPLQQPGAPTEISVRETASPEEVPGTEAIAQATPTPDDLTPASELMAACVIRCPQGCSYPGRCRRYVDLNNNRMCDLGECL